VIYHFIQELFFVRHDHTIPGRKERNDKRLTMYEGSLAKW